MEMELWLVIVISVCLAAFLKVIFETVIFNKSPHQLRLPPGPTAIPYISGFLWLRKSSPELHSTLRSLREKLGPIITLPVFTSRPYIFILSRSLAHKALIENGAVFADRPESLTTGKIFTCNQHTISSAGYGDTWRVLRRDLTSHILHPSKIKRFSSARSRILETLLQRLRSEALNEAFSPVKVVDHFRYAIFCLLVFMCFGERLDDDQVCRIAAVHRQLLLAFGRFQFLNFHPWITKLIFYRKWREVYAIRKARSDVVIPLIRARKQQISQITQNGGVSVPPAYVDSVMDLDIPSDDGTEKRKMTEEEIAVVCSEFLNAGTDTTSAALQWIMANLVKNQQIQTKLFDEISAVVGPGSKLLNEEDLAKMEYLKAVVLEGLRRHPPAHTLLHHAVTQETELGGYVIPKNAVVNFMVADMGWDTAAWEDPMEFRPERFVGEEFELSGTREIKMMPFGAGRRMCPGFGLALFHLEYFVANLVWEFAWTEAEGFEVNLEEKNEFTIVMKHPLHARITPRSRT